MNRQDFEGQAKYRYLVPMVYVLSWISMVVGPWLFPALYSQYCMWIVIYLAVRSLMMCGQNAQLVINSHNVLKRTKLSSEQDGFSLRHLSIPIYYTFIIPNYNESGQLLGETLQVLSRHKKATSTYIVFLAMQRHEQNSEQKALQLVTKFNGKFLHIGYTIHEIREKEHKGKASNVNWCVQNINATYEKLMIQQENVMITVIDADSWVPQVYIQQLEAHLFQHFQDRHLIIYQPPQIYTRNNMEVNVIIRTYDDMYSSMHASSLITPCGVTFSLSNYTLSYSLVKRVGFWDTVEEAIGQDMHMCLKTMFKTNGEVRTVPIFTPFNQLNIQTGNGSFTDVKQKFWQVERHARGVADVGYCLNMLSKNQWTLKTFWMTLSLIETFFLPIVAPWPLFVVFVRFALYKVGVIQNEGEFQSQQLLFIISIANTGTFVSNFIYEIFKRRSTSKIYNLPNSHIIRILQCSILSTINLLFMTVPAFVIGGFGNIFSNRLYIVAKKNSHMSLQGSELV